MHMNVVFGQENRNHMLRMSGCVVVMKLLFSVAKKPRSFSTHIITQAADDFKVVVPHNVLTLWCFLMMHHHTGVEGYHVFGFATQIPCFFFWGGGGLETKSVSTVTTARWFPGHIGTPTIHHQ